MKEALGKGLTPRRQQILPKLARDSGASPPPAGRSCVWEDDRYPSGTWQGRNQDSKAALKVLRFLKNLGCVLYEAVMCGLEVSRLRSSPVNANSQVTL